MRAQPAPARLRPGRGDAHRELAHLLEPPQSLRGWTRSKRLELGIGDPVL